MTKVTFLTIIFFILILPLGQIEKVPFGIPSVSIYLHDFVISFAIALGIFGYRRQFFKFLRLPLILPTAIFIGFSLVSLALNPLHLALSDWLIAFSYLVRFTVYALLYPLTIFLISEKPSRRNLLLFLLFFSGLAVAMFGLVQYLLYPNLRNLYYLGWDPHHYRLFSTFLDPNFTGIILVLTLFLGMGLVSLNLPKYPIRTFLIVGGVILTFVALILTYSRSSYIAFGLGLPVLLSKRKFWKFLLLFYLTLLLAVFSLPRPFGEGVRLERTSTITSRLKSYQQAITIIKRYPIFGVGFNAYRFGQYQMGYLPQSYWQETHSGSGSDNSFLFSWATAGIGGLISILWLLLSAFGTAGSVEKSRALNGALVRASLVSIIAHSFFVNSLFYPWVILWLWLLLATVAKSRLVAKC